MYSHDLENCGQVELGVHSTSISVVREPNLSVQADVVKRRTSILHAHIFAVLDGLMVVFVEAFILTCKCDHEKKVSSILHGYNARICFQ